MGLCEAAVSVAEWQAWQLRPAAVAAVSAAVLSALTAARTVLPTRWLGRGLEGLVVGH